MPKTVYVEGQEVSVEWLNAIGLYLSFDGLTEFDGHYQKIPNSWLSDDADQIKTQWNNFSNSFLVTAGTGLTVNYTGGTISLGDLTKFTIAGGTLVVPNNATSIIYISETGVVTQGLILPVRSIPLARLTTVAGNISGAIQDLRPRYQVAPRSNAIPVFGSGGYEGDVTVAANVTMSGQRFVKNFTLNAGVTLTADPGFLYIQASGDITINGTIDAIPSIPGGRGFAGTGVPMQYLADSGVGYGGGAGHNSAPSKSYSPFISLTGSGGAAGFGSIGTGNVDIITSKGGNGGGTVILEAAGNIIINGSILCNGGNAVVGQAYNFNPSNSVVILTGAGGGSGGLVWCKSLTRVTVNASAQIFCKGGNGANGVLYNFSNSSGGGGGGGGGWILFNSPNNNTSGSNLQVTGGVGGIHAGNPPGISSSIGGSYAGQGGAGNNAAGFPGSIGQIVYNSFAPV